MLLLHILRWHSVHADVRPNPPAVFEFSALVGKHREYGRKSHPSCCTLPEGSSHQLVLGHRPTKDPDTACTPRLDANLITTGHRPTGFSVDGRLSWRGYACPRDLKSYIKL
jgi:hypothetical protein